MKAVDRSSKYCQSCKFTLKVNGICLHCISKEPSPEPDNTSRTQYWNRIREVSLRLENERKNHQ